ncbi:hypothetical protein EV368DRAFT_52904 [Lentinula lateritia]|nr:hypothetical protein EV368DRAFT_52904 [Lentinula lateritia]
MLPKAAQEVHTGKPGITAKLGSEEERQKQYSIEKLLAQGFEHIEWDGRIPISFVDCSGRVIAILAGQPGSNYVQELLEAFNLFSEAGKEARLRPIPAGRPHRQGQFPAFNRGTTMGMGSPTPVAINLGFMGGILNRLVGAQAVRHMAAYQNGGSLYLLSSPCVYEEYKNVHNTVRDKLPCLPSNFSGLSKFGAAVFNLGGNVWNFKHRDFLNWPFGWCTIPAL